MSYAFRFSGGLRLAAVLLFLLALGQAVVVIIPMHDGSVEGQDDDAQDQFGIWNETVPNFDVQFMLDPVDEELSSYYNEKMAKLSPGMTARYLVIIINHGPVNDTIFIELSKPPRDEGWNWYFKETMTPNATVDLLSPQARDQFKGVSFTTRTVIVEASIGGYRYSRLSVGITGISKKDMELYGDDAPIDKDELMLRVGSDNRLIVPKWEDIIYYIDPGDKISIPFYATNLGNKDQLDFHMIVNERNFFRADYRKFECLYFPRSHILDYEWDEIEFTVYQGQTKRLFLNASVDWEFVGWDNVFQIRLITMIKNTSFIELSDPVTIIVKRYTELEAFIEPQGEIQVFPGENVVLNLTINNFYYNDDYIDDVLLFSSKGIRLNATNLSGSDVISMKLPAKMRSTIILNFSIPNELSSGIVDMALIVYPVYNYPFKFNLTFRIHNRSKIVLLPTDPLLLGRVSFQPGEQRSIVFGVRNEGNVGVNCSLVLFNPGSSRMGSMTSLLDRDWRSHTEWISQVREPPNFIDMRLDEIPVDTDRFVTDIGYRVPISIAERSIPFWIEVGETVWVSIRVTCLDEKGERIVSSIPVTALLLGYDDDLIFDEHAMVFDVNYPDLVFDDDLTLCDEEGKMITSAAEGQKTFFSVTVRNIGDGFSGPTTVQVFADDIEVMGSSIIPLAPGERFILKGNFSAIGGTRELHFYLDPENGVVESDDQFMEGSNPDANIIRAPLFVEGEKDGNGGLFFALMIFFIVILLLSALGVFTLYFWIRRLGT